MSDILATLADRYRCRSVAEATTRLLSLKRRGLGLGSHFSDISRVAASAAERQLVKFTERDA